MLVIAIAEHLGSVGLIKKLGHLCSGIFMIGVHLLANVDQNLNLHLRRGVKDARRLPRLEMAEPFTR